MSLNYNVILRIHNIIWVVIHFRPSVIELFERTSKFGNEFKRNEVPFSSTCFLRILLNVSLEMADKKQLWFQIQKGRYIATCSTKPEII